MHVGQGDCSLVSALKLGRPGHEAGRGASMQGGTPTLGPAARGGSPIPTPVSGVVASGKFSTL